MNYDTEQDYTNEKVNLNPWKRLFGYVMRPEMISAVLLKLRGGGLEQDKGGFRSETALILLLQLVNNLREAHHAPAHEKALLPEGFNACMLSYRLMRPCAS